MHVNEKQRLIKPQIIIIIIIIFHVKEIIKATGTWMSLQVMLHASFENK